MAQDIEERFIFLRGKLDTKVGGEHKALIDIHDEVAFDGLEAFSIVLPMRDRHSWARIHAVTSSGLRVKKWPHQRQHLSLPTVRLSIGTSVQRHGKSVPLVLQTDVDLDAAEGEQDPFY